MGLTHPCRLCATIVGDNCSQNLATFSRYISDSKENSRESLRHFREFLIKGGGTLFHNIVVILPYLIDHLSVRSHFYFFYCSLQCEFSFECRSLI